MNRLELVQALAEEVGFQRAITTTEGTLTADVARLVRWVDRAWANIQTRRPNWQWMRSSKENGGGASFTSVAGQATYALASMTGPTAATFDHWLPGTFRIYTTSIGTDDEQWLFDFDYDNWRDLYALGPTRNVQSRPVRVAISPNQSSLNLGQAPTAGYTITGDFYLKPSAMTLNADTPTGLPTESHYSIVYGAMRYYGRFAPAPEVYQDARRDYRRMMNELERQYLPKLAVAGSLA